MPALYALLVGINNYPDTRDHLRGCLNDVQHMRQFLESYCISMGVEFRPIVLTDDSATRQAIIDAFDHFQLAKPGDYCLFQFSGHGSQSAAPKEFEDFKHVESIVCWDSRIDGGYDLLDKELSYLIWCASQRMDKPFITIMDCCHSGNMRGEEIGVRFLRTIGRALPADQIIGAAHYKKNEDGQLSPPLGRRVHLGAARDVEFAKEVIAGGKPRGIFTYCLIEALEQTGSLISYIDLLERTKVRVKNTVSNQSAQFQATFLEDQNRGFLFSKIDAIRPSFLVNWDKEMGWIFNMGALHGIPAKAHDSKTVLELVDDGHIITVETVLANCSTVGSMEGYDTKRSYIAVIKTRTKLKLALSFADENDIEAEAILREQAQRQDSGLYNLQAANKDVDFLIHARNGSYYLTRNTDTRPVFFQEPGFNKDNAISFLQKLNTVAKWQQALELHNPDTRISDSALQVELYRVAEPGNQSDDAPVELIDWQTGPASFRYSATNRRPAFRLRLLNTSQSPIWASILYLGSDFSITNALLPKAALPPGGEVWATNIFKGYEYKTITIQIEDEQLPVADEYIKILLCTEELNTTFYNQNGLAATGSMLRGMVLRSETEEQDWAERTIWLKIERGVS
jgi:hypothetical protein